jgi:arsenite methyltransferase
MTNANTAAEPSTKSTSTESTSTESTSQACCADDASCCASFYERPDVRYLLGDSYHPGGVALSLELASHCELSPDKRILDVACGRGTTLAAVLERWPLTAIGLDVSAPAEGEGDAKRGTVSLRRGDAHEIPFDDGSFDMVLCECALSTFVEQPRALSEMYRVLSPGGYLAVSDMVVERAVPDALLDWVHAGTCLTHAHSFAGYQTLLRSAGLELATSWNANSALMELLGQVKRRLVGAALAQAAGQLPSEVKIDVKAGRDILREAEAAVREETIGYGVFIYRRPYAEA